MEAPAPLICTGVPTLPVWRRSGVCSDEVTARIRASLRGAGGGYYGDFRCCSAVQLPFISLL